MGRSRELAGMRILITGASQGIGRAMALLAAQRGMRVLATARKLELLQELAAQAGSGTLIPIQADIAVAADREKMVQAAQEHFGGLDILVNNAGIGATGHFADSDPEVLRQIMETNFFGTVETTRAFLPMLTNTGKLPAVVNVSSILGKRAIPGRSLYSASKFALEGWTQAIRAEFARFGIDVITINPGLTQTNFSQNMLESKAKMSLDHKRGMTSEEVAEATLNAIAKGKKSVNLTRDGKLLLFANRFMPGLIDRIAAKKVRKLFADEMKEREAKKAS
ncbi:MAG: SDR family NAD(P)-dependent oxidoreductase [Zavarzinella sp.]